MTKVGIFAGAFDPVHDGHLAFAKKALENGIEEVYFLPEPKPRMKPKVSDIKSRMGLINKEIADEPNLETIAVAQESFEGAEVIDQLKDELPDMEIVFMFGDDVLDHIETWQGVEILADKFELLIATRKYSAEEIDQIFQNLKSSGLEFTYKIIELNHDMSSTKMRLQNN